MLNKTAFVFLILSVNLIWLKAEKVDNVNREKRMFYIFLDSKYKAQIFFFFLGMFSLFSVVSFPNDECTGASSTTAEKVLGTCYSSSDCTAKGGSKDGNCASGMYNCTIHNFTILVLSAIVFF